MILLLLVCWVAFAVGAWRLLVVSPVPPDDVAAVGRPARRPGWRDVIEAVGERAAQVSARLGKHSKDGESDLAVLGETMATFYGEKVAGAVLGLLWIPVMRLVGVQVPLTVPASIFLALAAYFLPNIVLASKARTARQELRDGVAELAVLMSLAVSGGAGIDSAFASALAVARGRFSREVAEARVARPRETLSSSVDQVGERFGLPEATALGSALAATEFGTAVGDALDELAWSLVEDRRAESIAFGAQARTRMAMVGAGLMVPGYAALLILPGLRLALQALHGG
jgi:hypothetical protein